MTVRRWLVLSTLNQFIQLTLDAFNRVSWATETFTLKKLECSKQAYSLNSGAWNNKRGSWFYFVGFRIEIMIDGDRRGHSYCDVRGEILGSSPDELMRRHLPRIFSSIKNESERCEDDQIPS